jgi:hypothetical protein
MISLLESGGPAGTLKFEGGVFDVRAGVLCVTAGVTAGAL